MEASSACMLFYIVRVLYVSSRSVSCVAFHEIRTGILHLLVEMGMNRRDVTGHLNDKILCELSLAGVLGNQAFAKSGYASVLQYRKRGSKDYMFHLREGDDQGQRRVFVMTNALTISQIKERLNGFVSNQRKGVGRKKNDMSRFSISSQL